MSLRRCCGVVSVRRRACGTKREYNVGLVRRAIEIIDSAKVAL